MNTLQDQSGKSSSKRIWGSILLATGLIFSSILFAFSIKEGAKDAATAVSIINMFLMTGGGLLGIGVLEKIKK